MTHHFRIAISPSPSLSGTSAAASSPPAALLLAPRATPPKLAKPDTPVAPGGIVMHKEWVVPPRPKVCVCVSYLHTLPTTYLAYYIYLPYYYAPPYSLPTSTYPTPSIYPATARMLTSLNSPGASQQPTRHRRNGKRRTEQRSEHSASDE